MYDVIIVSLRLIKVAVMVLKSEKGFTLIELIVVVFIIGVLTTVLVPEYIGYIEKGKSSADKYSLGELNEATRVYYAGDPSPNPFETGGLTDDALLQVLVDSKLLTEKPEPQQADVFFGWDSTNKFWLLSEGSGTTAHELTTTEVTMGIGGWSGFITGSYTGTATEISIPKTLNGSEVIAIYQDVFSGKGITSVYFPSDGSVSRIHARAFKDNNLTEIVLPPSLTQIDYGAFLNNNITKVTIGAGVYLEGSVFQNSDAFKTAYEAQGAGTYIYTSGNWVKQ